jgi:L-serine/L-threonine ammonia-lyase
LAPLFLCNIHYHREIDEHYKAHKEEEIYQMKPDVIVTVCGGGGLLCGLLQGLHEIGWQDVPVVVSETIGAHSYAEAIKEGKLITLPEITSIARTLGAKTVCKEVRYSQCNLRL